MIRKILIANRGEIAIRIIRACREMGIETVAVYSEADREALHTQLADEAVCIGPAAAKDSYLNMEQIISATMITGADAIHPGFGFLSENSQFAKLCEACHITFIGPDSDIIARLGNKAVARQTMVDAGVPVIPGCQKALTDVKEALEIANDTLYGLGAGVWTRDAHELYRVPRAIQAGRVWVNQYHAYPAGAPFGGYKQSGIGRENHKMMLDHYRQAKNMLISYNKNKLGFF